MEKAKRWQETKKSSHLKELNYIIHVRLFGVCSCYSSSQLKGCQQKQHTVKVVCVQQTIQATDTASAAASAAA